MFKILKPLVAPTERIYYDGHCGLCQRSVRFVLLKDRTGKAFRFTPLDSDSFRNAAPPSLQESDKPTLVVQTADNRFLTRSSAVIHIGRRLGGIWRLFVEVGRLLPIRIRDWLYDMVAHNRYRLFSKPADVCPVVPPHLRARFDL